MPSLDILRGGQTRERSVRAAVGGVTGSGDPGVNEALGLSSRTASADLEGLLNAYKTAPTAALGAELRRVAGIVLGFGAESADAEQFLALIGGAGPAYTLPTPFVIHDFESATGWFPTNAGPITITAEAGNGLVFTDTSAGSSGTATNHNVINGDPATWGTIAIEVDLGGREAGAGSDRDPQLMLSGGIGVRIGSGGSAGSGGTYNSGASVGDNIAGAVENVGSFWGCGVAGSLTGLPSAGDIGIRTEAAAAPGGRHIRIKRLLGNAAGRPTVLIRCDDGLATQATTLLDMMNYYGFKGTAFVPWANIGVVGGRMSVAQVQTLRDAGWAICLDGTEDDAVMTDLADPAAVVAKLQEGRAWLAANGFAAEGGNHICYPNGIFGVNPNPVQKTGASGSLGSAVITGIASTADLSAGMRVVGVGIPNSPVTRIATVDSGTQITLTQNLTVAMSSGRFKAVADSSAFYSRLTQDALAAAGFKTGWTTLGSSFYSRYGVGNRALVLPGNSTLNLVAGTIEGYIDDAIARGTTVQFYLHGVTGAFNPADGTDDGAASSGLTSGTGPLNAALAYLKTKVDANLVSVLTVPEWYARDCATPATPPSA